MRRESLLFRVKDRGRRNLMVTEARPRTGMAKENIPEANVQVSVNLDKPGYTVEISADHQEAGVDLGILIHMLEQFFRFAEFGANIVGHGDYAHHAAEETAKILGQAIKGALGDTREAIKRSASHIMPMEGILVTVALDLSNRGPTLIALDVLNNKALASMAQHMLDAIAKHGGIDLYCKVEVVNPTVICNDHHALETIGKALGFAMYEATRITRTVIPGANRAHAVQGQD